MLEPSQIKLLYGPDIAWAPYYCISCFGRFNMLLLHETLTSPAVRHFFSACWWRLGCFTKWALSARQILFQPHTLKAQCLELKGFIKFKLHHLLWKRRGKKGWMEGGSPKDRENKKERGMGRGIKLGKDSEMKDRAGPPFWYLTHWRCIDWRPAEIQGHRTA